MRNNLLFFEKELIKPILISKFFFSFFNSLPKLNKCIFSIYLIDVNKFNILFSFVFFKFFLLYKKPLILNKEKRFPKKKIFYKKNNDLNFLIDLRLENFQKIYFFLEFFLITFLFSRFRKYCKKKVIKFEDSLVGFYDLDFLFFKTYLKGFIKFSSELYFMFKRMRLSFFIFYNSTNNSKVIKNYLKLLKIYK